MGSKVCMVVFSFYPADPRVRREAESLEQAGIPVDILCLRGEEESSEERFGGIRAIRIMGGAEDKETFSRYLILSLLFALMSFAWLIRLSLNNRYTLVQFHNMPDYLVFAGAFHKLLGRPVVLDLHDLTPELFESKWGQGGKRRLLPIIRLVEKLACGFADALITTSAGFRQKLIERGIPARKITLVLNAPDQRIFQTRKPREFTILDRDVRLLYHGTITKRFGVHVAVEAVHLLKDRLPGVRLDLYGKYDASFRLHLETMIGELGLKDHVRLNGYVSLERIAQIIEESDIGVVPYLSDPFMNLALSTKTFEYACMGLPVAASNIASIRSIFGDDCVLYFEPGSADDLARTVLEMCGDPKARAMYAERAAASYQEIAWPAMSKRYKELLKSLGGLPG